MKKNKLANSQELLDALNDFYPSSPFNYYRKRRGRKSYVHMMMDVFSNLWWEDYYIEHPRERPRDPMMDMLLSVNTPLKIKKSRNKRRTILVKYNQMV